jgi:uncharacterized protein with HEPN domain
MKDESVHLRHILDAADFVLQAASAGKDKFLNDRLMRDALLRNLQTLAESTQHLSNATKAPHPNIPWKIIARFPNILTHDYLGLDFERIWMTI